MRYYIQFISYYRYLIIDTNYNEVIFKGNWDEVNAYADTLTKVDDFVHY